MHKLFLLLLLPFLLYGQYHPKLYASLGERLFDAAGQFELLTTNPSLSTSIHAYRAEADRLHVRGMRFESQPNISVQERREYLSALRTLKMHYDSLIGSLQQILSESIKDDDYARFSQYARSDLDPLFDSDAVRHDAIAYYRTHRSRGTIPRMEQLIASQNVQTTTPKKTGSSPDNATYLRIIIKTNNGKDAGTEGLMVRFIVNENHFGSEKVYDTANEHFQKGGTVILDAIKVKTYPDMISNITLRVDGNDAWMIEEISFQFKRNNRYSREYTFGVNQWFSTEAHDLKVLKNCRRSRTFFVTPTF